MLSSAIVMSILGDIIAADAANKIIGAYSKRSGDRSAAELGGSDNSDDRAREGALLGKLPLMIFQVQQQLRHDLPASLELFSDEQVHLLSMALLMRCGDECSELERLCGFSQSAEAIVLSLTLHALWERKRAVSVLAPAGTVREWIRACAVSFGKSTAACRCVFDSKLSLAENVEQLLVSAEVKT